MKKEMDSYHSEMFCESEWNVLENGSRIMLSKPHSSDFITLYILPYIYYFIYKQNNLQKIY